MIEIIFKRNSGSYRIGRVASFQPALADFFVSKLRVAEYYEPPKVELPTFNEFALPEGDDLLTLAPKSPSPTKKKAPAKKKTYETREMKAAE